MERFVRMHIVNRVHYAYAVTFNDTVLRLCDNDSLHERGDGCIALGETRHIYRLCQTDLSEG